MDRPRPTRWWLMVAIWTAMLLLALLLDKPIAQFMRDSGVAEHLRWDKLLHDMMKAPGEYWFTILVMFTIGLAHKNRWRASILVFFATCPVAVCTLLKWGFGRMRPFKGLDGPTDVSSPFVFVPFADGLHGIFDTAPNVCFPSGHTALAFATAAAMSILIPRGRWIFYALACMVGVERVLENAHWLSDVIAAAALGIAGARVVHSLVWEKLRGDFRHGAALPVVGDPGLQ